MTARELIKVLQEASDPDAPVLVQVSYLNDEHIEARGAHECAFNRGTLKVGFSNLDEALEYGKQGIVIYT